LSSFGFLAQGDHDRLTQSFCFRRELFIFIYLASTFPFEELIVDLHDLITNDYLDPLARFLLAFTSKRYLQRLKSPKKLMIDSMADYISKLIGAHGSARQLVWFQQNLDIFVDFKVVVRHAVVVGNMSLLTQFRWEEDLSGSERALRCTFDQGASFRYSMVKLSGHIGCNGSKRILDYFLHLELQVDWPTFVEGALLGGRLSLVEEYRNIYCDVISLESFKYAALCGNIEVLEYMVRTKKIAFTDPGDKFFIDVEYMIDSYLYTQEPVFNDVMFDPTSLEDRFLKLLAFLHERGVQFSSDPSLAKTVLRHVIFYDLPECIVYLENLEQLVSGSVVPRTYFANAIGREGFRSCSISRVCKVIRSYMPGFLTMDELNNFFEATLIRNISEGYLISRGDNFFELVDLVVDPEMKLYPLPRDWLRAANPPCDSHLFMESPEFAHFVERLLQHRICIPFRVIKRVVKSFSDLSALQRIVELFMPLYQLGQQLGLISGDRSGKKSLDLFEAALRRPYDDLIPLFNILLAVGHRPVDFGHLFHRILTAVGEKKLTMKQAEEISKFFDLPGVLIQADIDSGFRYVSPANIDFILRMNCRYRFTSDAFAYLFTEDAPLQSLDDLSDYFHWKLDYLKTANVTIPSDVIARLLGVVKRDQERPFRRIQERPFRRIHPGYIHPGHLFIAVKLLVENYGVQWGRLQEFRLLYEELVTTMDPVDFNQYLAFLTRPFLFSFNIGKVDFLVAVSLRFQKQRSHFAQQRAALLFLLELCYMYHFDIGY